MSQTSKEKEVYFEDIIGLRELIENYKIDPTLEHPNVRWDYLTLYDQGGNVLARSKRSSRNEVISVFYKGLQFLATPGYNGNEIVSVEWTSLIKCI